AASSALMQANAADQRGGKRNAATITRPNSRNCRSNCAEPAPGPWENTQTVKPRTAAPIPTSSKVGADGAENSRARQRTAQLFPPGATDNEPNQLPAHHSCHSCQ